MTRRYPGLSLKAKIGKNIKVGIGAVIEDDVVIGDNCFIGHYAIIRPNTRIGNNVDIRAHAWIANDVVIGNEVTIYQYANVCGWARLEDKIYFGCKSICTNAPNPMVYNPDGNNWDKKPPIIRSGVVIATGCILGPGVEIGVNSILGMGSILTRSIPPNQVWFGTPAKYVKEVPEHLKVIR